MAIITLTTDIGTKDHYVARIKGKLLNLNPQLNIIDISHEVAAFNQLDAVFVLSNSFESFPKGSIHLVSVLSSSHPDGDAWKYGPEHIAISYKGHYFIGPDNGVFSMLCKELPDKIVSLDIGELDDIQSFPIGDIYCRAAQHLANEGTIEMLGEVKSKMYLKSVFAPSSSNDAIKGAVAYIDHFGNVITNIHKELFLLTSNSRQFSIELPFKSQEIKEISSWYSEVTNGDLLALFNSSDHLEIAINQGSAHRLLGIKLQEPININFHD